MTEAKRLTKQTLASAKPRAADYWISDNEGTRGGGRLKVRIRPTGARLFYYRYTIGTSKKLIPIGPWSETETAGCYTLAEAREKARDYAELYRNPESRDVAEHLRQVAAEKEAVRAALLAEEKRLADEAKEAFQYTLKALCLAYVKHLVAGKKSSAGNVKSGFECHVYGTEWADKPAKHFTPRQAAALLRGIMEKGTGRTAAKVRSYLRTAYAVAMTAETDATAPQEMILFGIESNPIASTAALSKFNQPRKRNLTPSEMGALWRWLWNQDADPSLQIRALRCTLLLGGQRGLQLLRVPLTDVDLESGTIMLLDKKGRRDVPRQHLLPLEGKVLKEVAFLVERAKTLESPWLFASIKRRKGEARHLGQEVLSTLVADVSKEFVKDKISKEAFRFSDLRRTAETLQASRGVQKDTRAQIQSHGISGVQSRHYDLYEYMDEKKLALRQWEAHLDRMAAGNYLPANVQELRPTAEAA